MTSCVVASQLQPIAKEADNSIGLVTQITQNQISGLIKASPRCWAVAVETMSELMHLDFASSGEFCSGMTQLQQDILALELARCHMEKSSTAFFSDDDAVSADDCTAENLVDQGQVNSCLGVLETSSYNIYVQFTMHVQQLCVRFTDELLAARKEQAALLLAETSRAVNKQLYGVMRQINETMTKITDQQRVLHDQTLKIMELDDAIGRMAKNVSSVAKDHIEPVNSVLRSISYALSLGSVAFSWARLFTFPLVCVLLTYLLTMNRITFGLRSTLVNLTGLEAAAEIFSYWANHHGYISDDQRMHYVQVERDLLLIVSACVYAGGMITNLLRLLSGYFYRQPPPQSAIPPSNTSYYMYGDARAHNQLETNSLSSSQQLAMLLQKHKST